MPEVHGIKVPHDIHVHIAGIDLIRGEKANSMYWRQFKVS
jgi:uncharacterized circularly permuted ATP-grasp superfamily protein